MKQNNILNWNKLTLDLPRTGERPCWTHFLKACRVFRREWRTARRKMRSRCRWGFSPRRWGFSRWQWGLPRCRWGFSRRQTSQDASRVVDEGEHALRHPLDAKRGQAQTALRAAQIGSRLSIKTLAERRRRSGGKRSEYSPLPRERIQHEFHFFEELPANKKNTKTLHRLKIKIHVKKCTLPKRSIPY